MAIQRFLFCLFSIPLTLLALAGRAQAGSVSDSLDGLNNDGPTRQALLLKAGQQSTAALGQTGNFAAISAFLISHLQGQSSLLALTSESAYFALSFADLKTPQTLARMDLKTGQWETLIDVAQLGAGANVVLQPGMQISPDGRWLVGQIGVNGAVTLFNVFVYDLQQKRLVAPATKEFGQILQFASLPNHQGFVLALFNKADLGAEAKLLDIDLLASTGDLASSLIDVQSLLSPAATATLAAQEAPAFMSPQFANRIVTSMEWSFSKDGTPVAYWLVRKRDATADGSHPALIDSYGGFGVSIVNYPIGPEAGFTDLHRAFLDRGGLIVVPFLRGGGEGGDTWHTSAQGPEKKIKTFEDLIGVAQILVKKGWSTPQKIISTGASNGGLTVAASALLAPGTFGLVIPVAGVLDLAKFTTLDKIVGPGWVPEYGDPATQKPLLEKLSPVELAKAQSSTQFMILAGDSDDRVNFAHSLKFYEALQRNGGHPDNARLIVVPGAGHFSVQGIANNRPEEIVARASYWATIYDYLGWVF